MNLLLVLIGLAAHSAGFFGFDFRYSMLFKYYLGKEKFKLARNEFGQPDPKKAWIPMAIMQAVGVGVGTATYLSDYSDWWAFGYMAPTAGTGIAHMLQGLLRLRKVLSDDRLIQIKARKARKAALTGDRDADIARLAGTLRVYTYGQVGMYCPDFLRWMWVEAGSGWEAQQKLAPLVYDWLLLPETDQKKIWKDITFHPKED